MDRFLEKCFEMKRWEYAIDKGVVKGIKKSELIQLCTPAKRAAMKAALMIGIYEIGIPHMAEIPKDDGTMRTVYVNDAIDRVFLSIVNDILFEDCSSMIHPRCKSYQHGIGTGRVVKEVSKKIVETGGEFQGVKADLSKYFDSVPVEFIDKAFDKAEEIMGKSCVFDCLRKFYHDDRVYDLEKNLIHKYQSLRQGSAVAAWLADVVLYDMDETISKLDVYYVRYSDDILIIGKEWKQGHQLMQVMLENMGMKLNPKKVEVLSKCNYFKFLGFSIKGDSISLSKRRIKDFQKEIEKRTIRNKNPKSVVHDVCRYLYYGNGEYSWATSVLTTINSEADIQTLNTFVMDYIRATQTGKKRQCKLGGLGYEVQKKGGVITRGRGQYVTSNFKNTEKEIKGYYTLNDMRKVLLTSREAYKSLVRSM